MVFFRTILGAALGSIFCLAVFRFIPFTPDLSDWGGKAFPRTYLFPLLVVAIVSYIGGWIAAKVSPVTGRLCGMLSSLIAAGASIGWNTGSMILMPLFHHPAYPVFSDHALLGLAVLLVGGHLGGFRIEKGIMKPEAIEIPPVDFKPDESV
jgi:hypothetical protein